MYAPCHYADCCAVLATVPPALQPAQPPLHLVPPSLLSQLLCKQFSYLFEEMAKPNGRYVYVEFPHGVFPLGPLVAGTLCQVGVNSRISGEGEEGRGRGGW